jgi:four helix bundle protein
MTADADGARQTGPALEKMHQFVLWLIPTVEKFPQRQRFLLGDRIQTAGLDILEGLIEATYSRGGRLRLLEIVNVRLEKLRILFRIAMELRYLDLRRYEHAARSLDEIGRLVGGWMKAHRGQTAP